MDQKALDKLIEDYKPEDQEGDHDLLAEVPEGALELRRFRKKTRYQCYRLRTEAEGGNLAESNDRFKRRYEVQDLFEGWLNFAVTWDVALDDPYRIIHRDKSETEEWDELIAATYPILEPGGNLKYPDPKVREAVREHQEKQNADSNSDEV